MYLVNPKTELKTIDPNLFFINDLSVASWMFSSGLPEKSLMEWCISNFIKPDKSFIDIGAHIGSYSWTLAPHALHTYSFECNPEVFNCLCANIFLKKLSDKITPYKLGLSSHETYADYYSRSNDGGGNGFTYLGEKRDLTTSRISLNVKPLDSFNFQNINFLKIDVEGHEKEVLIGAQETLKRNNYPSFIFESWEEWRESSDHHIPAKELRKDLFDYIGSTGYQIIPITGYPEMFLATFN